MAEYPTIYKDANGRVRTTIINTFDEKEGDCLEMTLGEVRFRGRHFNDMTLVAPETYDPSQLSRFTLNERELCGCKLTFTMPVVVLRDGGGEEDALMTVLLVLGMPAENGGIDREWAEFGLVADDEIFKAGGDSFEAGMQALREKMQGRYRFRSCFGCRFADYSAYGAGFFGALRCFRDCRKAFAAATDKQTLLELEKQSIAVQETHWCKAFEPRPGG